MHRNARAAGARRCGGRARDARDQHSQCGMMKVGEAAYGKRFTDSHDGDQGLRWAREAGWIESCGWQPTRQQQFTGVGGDRISGKVSKQTEDFYLSCHGWQPVRAKESEALAWAAQVLEVE